MEREFEEDLDISVIKDGIDIENVPLKSNDSTIANDEHDLFIDSLKSDEDSGDEDSGDEDFGDEDFGDEDSEDEDIEYLFNLQREPLSEINLFFIYMNSDNSIEKIEKDMESMESMESMQSIISKERLLQIVQTKRNCGGKKYRLNDILTFQLPFEKEHLESFIHSEENLNHLVSVPIFNEIVFQPALYIFHDFIALYFFFSEYCKPLKSILHNPENKRVTKKVRISVDDSSYSDHKRKSLKRFMRRGNSTRKVSAHDAL